MPAAHKTMEPTYLLAKSILKPGMRAWFRWTMEGLANVPASGSAILAFNHISYLDPLVAAFAVDEAGRTPRFLAKSELFQDRRIGWILRGAGQIEVKRGTRDAAVALEQAIAAARAGEIIVVFPEGTVTTDPDLRPMPPRSGVARLALLSGAPLIPCAVWGTQNVWPKGYASNWRPRQDVVVRIGTPVEVSGDPDDRRAWVRVSRDVMAEIQALVASIRPAVPDRRRPRKGRAA